MVLVITRFHCTQKTRSLYFGELKPERLTWREVVAGGPDTVLYSALIDASMSEGGKKKSGRVVLAELLGLKN